MIETFVDKIRKATTFFLALLLWMHAIFLLNVQLPFSSAYTRLLHFSTSEVVIFALLITFSLLTASGFWKMLRSLLYIYFFPFFVAAYGISLAFLALRAMNRWFKTQAYPRTERAQAVVQNLSTIDPLLPPDSVGQVRQKISIGEIIHFLLRPFRRFMLLWCLLLLVTTHLTLVWLCLLIVLVQLTRKLFAILKVLLFSDPWLRKYGAILFTGLDSAFAVLTTVSREDVPNDELKHLLDRLNLWKSILAFLKDPYLLSRWAWVLAVIFLGSIYTYIALLFSFAYYGVARVSGVFYSWPDAFITSLFIPFFVSELPHILAVKLLGGIHCFLVILIGIGTIVNFLRRKLEAIRRTASDFSDRFEDQSIREKYAILEEKFATTPHNAPLPTDTER